MDTIGGGGGGGGGKRTSSSVGGSRRRSAPIHFLGTDLLCSIFCRLDHVHLIRCSATCKSWFLYSSLSIFEEVTDDYSFRNFDSILFLLLGIT